MAQAATIVVREFSGRMRAQAGLPFSVAAIAERESVVLPIIAPDQIVARNVAADIAEKTIGGKYPAFYIYCERIDNLLREKFRTFSGTATMCVDVRVSQDRMGDIERELQLYVDAVTEVLDNNRGTWPGGMFYSGGYEVAFSALKHGGKNFLQSAKVRFVVNISSD